MDKIVSLKNSVNLIGNNNFFENSYVDLNELYNFDNLINSIYSEYKVIESNIDITAKLKNRFDSIIKLKDNYDKFKLSNESDNIYMDYSKKMAIIIEMFNNMSHLIDFSIDYNSKKINQQLVDARDIFFKYKELLINKLSLNCNNKEEYGIISGVALDAKANKNKNVFVIDIPTVGQLSWHITDITKNNLNEMYGLKEYKYEIQKDTEDFRKSGTELNSKLLLDKYTDTRNTHNELVTYIPEGCEDELELALDLYYEVKNNPNKYEHPEKIIRQACYARGKVPSQITFKKILTYVLGNNNYEYDEKDMMKWRENYERELEERDNN